MKFNDTLLKAVERDLTGTKIVPMLLGEPGIGKSSWVENLAERMHTRVFVLSCNQLADKADLTGGRLVPNADKTDYGQVFYPHEVVRAAIEYAKDNPRETPILFLDEVNRTSADVTTALLSLSTSRSIGNSPLPKNLKIVAAGNDKGNITTLDEASRSRFDLLHVEPDINTYLGLDQNLNPYVRKTLIAHPECLFCKSIKIVATNDDGDDDTYGDGEVDIDEILDDSEDMSQITTPRTITGLSDWLNMYSNDELMELISDTHVEGGEEVSALEELIRGKVGATKFTGFLLAEIADGINNAQADAVNNVVVGKPSCYDDLKAQKTLDDVDAFIENMTESERSGCLVYAMYEAQDNAAIIRKLAEGMTCLSGSDNKTFMKLAGGDLLDEENKQAFLDSGSPLADNLRALLS